MRGPAPVIVKLGGSFAYATQLKEWIAAIAGCAGRVVLVPGGGPFADTVRQAQAPMGFDDRAAHHMALLAMEQYACALTNLHEDFELAASLDAILCCLAHQKVPVILSSRMCLDATDISHCWDVTSDSIAAWLSGKLGADLLLLIKHSDNARGSASVVELCARGMVDIAFAGFLRGSGATAYLVGASDYVAVSRAVCGEPVGIRIDP